MDERSLKDFRDAKGYIDTAFEDGQLKKALEVARTAKLMGLAIGDISKLTGLSVDEINLL